MEADTSIRRKTGHFYFALTRRQMLWGPDTDTAKSEPAGTPALSIHIH